MVLGGPSSFLKDMFPTEEPCECNRLTIILPDFEAATVKNLLGLLYTGKNIWFVLFKKKVRAEINFSDISLVKVGVITVRKFRY